jgi:hypothetical protein
LPEQAEIEIHDADHLYREIRIKNELEDEHGKKVKLKEHADVDVVVEECFPQPTNRNLHLNPNSSQSVADVRCSTGSVS